MAVDMAVDTPPFDAGTHEVDKGRGVSRDHLVQERALAGVREFALAHLSGAKLVGTMESPITGTEGNREFLLCLKKSG